MKILLVLLFIPVFCVAQVGVNTTNPEALLEVRSSNQVSPSNIDGILIPKIDEFSATNPTALQDGMLVYATGNGSVAKGFYYWDNNSTSWVSFTGATIEKIDDLLDAKSDNDGTNDGSSIFLGVNAGTNDDGTNNYNVGIGFEALMQSTTGYSNTGIGYHSLNNNTTGLGNTSLGRSSLYYNTAGNLNTAMGYFAGANNNGSNNVFLGSFAGYNVNSSNRLYIENSNVASPLIYGEFDNDFLRVNGDFEVEKPTNASATVVTPFGYQSSLKLFERGTSGDYGFEFQYDGNPDKLYLWSRTFAGNEGIRMTWLKDGRVGMNDTDPDARLDIEAINQATPTNTDGILIPRIDVFPATNPGINQNGMLVFLTLDNSFYYWNNSATTWVNLMNSSNAVERINDLADGKSDNDGSDNGSSIFLGVNAGANDNETANNNVGIGYNALQNNVSGAANTAVGSTALLSNTSGSNNSAFGRRALYFATTASGNSAFGSQSLEANTTGYSNVAFGYESLTSNTTGYYNTAIGFEALESNTSGNFNTALGYEALSSSVGVNNNTAIGFQALRVNTLGYNNSALGYQSLEDNTTGYFNTAIGYQSLQNNTTGNRNTAIGHSASISNNFSNTTAIGYNADPNSPNQVRVGNASVAIIGGYANWSLFSDKRLKTNIKEDVIGLEFIKKLRPVSYNYDMDAIARFQKTPDSLRLKNAEQKKAQEIQTGFIAQEVEQAAQEVGFSFHGIVKPHDKNGTYALRYAEFVVPIVKAIQDQQEIIEAQKEEIEVLKNEIKAIKALLIKE